MAVAELLFTGQIAPDAALIGGPAGKQAHSALSRLEEALGERGLALGDMLRLRLFVEDLGELPAIEAAIDSHAGTEPPAMSVIELPANSVEPSVALTLDAVAAPDARAHRRLGPQSVRFGPWVFLGAVTAADPRAVFAHMQERLRGHGARLCDVVRVEGWLTFPMSDYGPLGETRSALVGEAGLLPASAAVQVGRVGSGGERLAFEAIAFVPEDRGRKARHEAASRLADFYVDARAAGGYVFTSGEVPDGRGTPAEQAREVYERLGAHLAAHGAMPTDVLQQTVFVRAFEDGERGDAIADGTVVSEAARAFYGASTSVPPTTLLPVADFGFRPGCAVEIELVAATDARRADGR
jgi:enamine deaminase RidA (YjgF/YER057c/UK114 family)